MNSNASPSYREKKNYEALLAEVEEAERLAVEAIADGSDEDEPITLAALRRELEGRRPERAARRRRVPG